MFFRGISLSGLLALTTVLSQSSFAVSDDLCARMCPQEEPRCPSPCPPCPNCPAPHCPEPRCPSLPAIPPCPVPQCPSLPEIPKCEIPQCPSLPEIPACPTPLVNLSCPDPICPKPACPSLPQCPQCPQLPKYVPEGYRYVRGIGSYKFHSGANTWSAANSTCTGEGAHLAIPDTQEELDYLLGIMEINNVKYSHVGFYVNEHGNFQTVFGQPMSNIHRSFWNQTQPKLIYQCVYLHTEWKRILTEKCSDRERFVCELF